MQTSQKVTQLSGISAFFAPAQQLQLWVWQRGVPWAALWSAAN